MNKTLTSLVTAALAVTSLQLTSCDTVSQGVVGGAALGAIVGGATGRGNNVAAGAAIGAAAGGLAAVLVAENESAYYRGGQYSDPYRSYPVGQRTGRGGFVLSPYAPYYEIDVRGIPHGALVRDPSCGRLFIRP